MKKIIILILALLSFSIFADIPEETKSFEDQEQWEEGFEYLNSVLNQADRGIKPDLLANMSQFQLEIGDIRDAAGAGKNELLSLYEQGELFARDAIAMDRNNVEAYFWAAANIGRWGQTKGILDSLFKAGPMREDLTAGLRIDSSHADSWYLLGMLYFEVPPVISFGNKNWAISYQRKAIDQWIKPGQPLTYQYELARFLHSRNWSASKRVREWSNMTRKYNSKQDVLEKFAYYEGAMSIDSSRFYSSGKVLKNLSDREEAVLLLENIISFLNSKGDLLPSEVERLADTKALLAEM